MEAGETWKSFGRIGLLGSRGLSKLVFDLVRVFLAGWIEVRDEFTC
jgi:hypothetical protein